MDLIAILRSMIVCKMMMAGTFSQRVSGDTLNIFCLYILSIWLFYEWPYFWKDDFIRSTSFPVFFCDYMKRKTFFEFGPRTMCLRWMEVAVETGWFHCNFSFLFFHFLCLFLYEFSSDMWDDMI